MGIYFNHCGRLLYEPGSRRWHLCHPDYDLWFVYAGGGALSAGECLWKLKPGDCFLIPPGFRHDIEQQASERLGITYIHFIPPKKEEIRLSLYRHVEAWSLFDQILHRVVDALQGDPRRGLAKAQDWFTAALHELRDQEKKSGAVHRHAEKIETLCAGIREAPGRHFSVKTLADSCCMTPTHLARIFREIKGLSPQEYVIQTRMERAGYLLKTTDFTASQIAEMLGYRDCYFFGRQFKKKIGMTPIEYRRDR